MDEKIKKQTKNRLARIEGHVRSVKEMVAAEQDLESVMQQIVAIKKALESTQKIIFIEQISQNKLNKDQITKQVDRFLR